MSRRHLVTGATGFIGGALTLELLARTDDEIHCLVRAPKDSTAGARIRETLFNAAAQYGTPELGVEIERRCHALEGDVTQTLGGIRDVTGLRFDEVWHSAASLRHVRSAAAEIERTNVEGTRHVLGLARRTRAEVFNYMSTAYVAGRRTGVIPEEPSPPGGHTNNLYEASKVSAEALVLGEAEMHTRILRPSIVIGHSQTKVTFSTFGLYGALMHFIQFRDRVRSRLGAYLSHYRAQIFGDPDTPINFIPVDYVARNAAAISRSSSDEHIFHLCNGDPLTIRELMTVGFAFLGMREPELVPSKASFSSLDRALDGGLDFYASYFRFPKVFDRGHTDAACGIEASNYPLHGERLTSFLDWFVVDRQQTRARHRVNA